MNKELANLISESTYVSFDIFDTAIIRNVLAPSDVFALVKEQYESCNLSFLPDYPKKRREAEKKARKKIWAQKRISEVTLDAIFECLESDFGLDSKIVQILKQLELETEYEVCRKNAFIFSIYNYCLNHNKKIIFISDMYLPLQSITNILRSRGYDYFDKVFLSSSIGHTKAKGNIYRFVVDELGCEPEQILHIGDNYESDVVMAKKNGIKTYYYEKPIVRALHDPIFKNEKFPQLVKRKKSLEESFYLAKIVNKYYCDITQEQTHSEDGFWYNFGYKNIGIIFWGFISWLIDSSAEDSIEKIFFLSRDGYIMKEVYDLASEYHENLPPAEYLYASRRALNIPSIVEFNDLDIDFLLSGTSTLKVSQFLQRAGLEPNNYVQEIKVVGFNDMNQEVISGKDYVMLKSLFDLLASDVKELAELERKNLIISLNSVGILDKKKVAVVDIGWHGSMQYSISRVLKALGKDIEVQGYYFGTKRKAVKFYNKGMNMSGYLCNFGSPKYYNSIIKLSTEIFEFIHSAPHGSVIKYACEDQGIKPVLEKSDLGSNEVRKVKMMHMGALEFISEYLEHLEKYPFIKTPKDMAIRPLHRVLKVPTLEEAEQLGDIEHAEGFGDVNTKRYIAQPPSYTPLLLLRFDKLFMSLKSSFWKMGYIKRFLSKTYRIF